MLDAARGNEGNAVEKISKLQEEKKVLQVQFQIKVFVDARNVFSNQNFQIFSFRNELLVFKELLPSLMQKNEKLKELLNDLKKIDPF